MGQPKNSLIGRLEHSAVIIMRVLIGLGDINIKRDLLEFTGINIPRCVIHKILRDDDLAKKEPKKGQQHKWIHYQRKHSNSLWHTDWKLLDNRRRFICHQDDAFRFVVGHGMFEYATTENALLVLEDVIKNYAKPKQILTDQETQFCVNAGGNKKRCIQI